PQRAAQFVKQFRSHGGAKREESPAGKRRAAQRTLELGDAQATLVGIVLFRTPGQRLGQTAHCVPSALKQCAQRRGQRRISVAKDRVQVLQDVHRTSEKRMAFFLRGRERSVFLFPGASVVRLFVERISERLLLFAPRLVCRLGFLVGRFESQVVERLLE